jgi:hypothetical protein
MQLKVWGLAAYTTDNAKKSRRSFGAEAVDAEEGGESSGCGGQEDCLSATGVVVQSLEGPSAAMVSILGLEPSWPLSLSFVLSMLQPFEPLLVSSAVPMICCAAAAPRIDGGSIGDCADATSTLQLVSGTIDAMRMREFILWSSTKHKAAHAQVRGGRHVQLPDLRASSSCALSSRT